MGGVLSRKSNVGGAQLSWLSLILGRIYSMQCCWCFYSNLAVVGIQTKTDDQGGYDSKKEEQLSNKQLFVENHDYVVGLFYIFVVTLSIFLGFLYENTGTHQLGTCLSLLEKLKDKKPFGRPKFCHITIPLSKVKKLRTPLPGGSSLCEGMGEGYCTQPYPCICKEAVSGFEPMTNKSPRHNFTAAPGN
ncbi:hypothetical protein glysoja_041027 [Glycine soja]|uniref:Uncharacterized protein n=1 Tax=Glycine soja TaxID=3848 RepID=A0A0B2SFJ6_GLYSO|nr:hypothetical protein glysoja_041027 [Glycine soja]